MFEFSVDKPLPDYGLFGVHRKFRRISVQLTSRCHNKCTFCSIPDNSIRKNGIMGLEEFTCVLRALPDFRGRILLALNGESFLLDNLPEYCALTRRHWPHASIQLITTLNIDRGPEYLASLFASGLDSLQISCYGYTATQYAAVHGVDRFDDLCANIRYLATVPDIQQRDVRLFVFTNSLSSYATPETASDMVKFLRFAAVHGVSATDLRQQHSWQGRVKNATPWQTGTPFPCSVVWGARADHLNVSWEGNVVPCCYFHGDEYVFGNMLKSSLEEIFNSDAYVAFYKALWERRLDAVPLCGSCTLIHDQSGSVAEFSRLAAYDGQRLTGLAAYFWGGGEAWRMYKQYFKGVRPKTLLMDTPNAPLDVDGIPVDHPDNCLREPCEKLPLVVFAQPQNSGFIIKKIIEKYPHYTLKDITMVPAAMRFSNLTCLTPEELAQKIEESLHV